MGDGVLAFFGAPVAHEDDPLRAVRCGLDMTRAVDELSAELNAKEPIDLKVRVGINTARSRGREWARPEGLQLSSATFSNGAMARDSTAATIAATGSASAAV